MLPNKLQLGLLAVAATLIVNGGEASADLLTVRAEARGGVSGGKGMFGERSDESFHEGHGALGYGVAAGAEVFLIDLWVQHDQYLDSGDVSTWTQFMAGFDVEIGFGDKKGSHFNDSGKEVGGYDSIMAELGMGVGFGVGTGQQVTPPLDNGQVTDKGFLLEGRAFVAYRLTKLMAVGVTLPAQFGYFTKSGAGTAANNVDNHYSGVNFAAMLTFRSSWNLK